jgi:hypothetical protein
VESPTESVSSSGTPWLLIAVIAGAVLLVAIVVAAVLLSRRGRPPAGAQPHPGPPQPAPQNPGWYPDPHGGARLRFFDGREWTPATQD